MSYEEKDLILRQIKQTVKGLGQMIGRESIKEIINLEVSESQKLADEELDDILLLLEVEEKMKGINQVEALFSMSDIRYQELTRDYSSLTMEEREKFKRFLNRQNDLT